MEYLHSLCDRRKLFHKFSYNGEKREYQSLKYGVMKQLPTIFFYIYRECTKAPQGGNGLFSLLSWVTVCWGKLREELKKNYLVAGTEAEGMEENCFLGFLEWLLQPAFLYNLGPAV